MARNSNIRERVLEAAIQSVVSSGSIQFSLEGVAARAGVSKGGLLHHFRSKAALLEAMVDRVIADYDRELHEVAANEGEGVADHVRLQTYLTRSFSGLGKARPTARVVLAVQAEQPELLKPLHDYFRRRVRGLKKHASPRVGEVLALMLMADGLWIFDALGAQPFGKAERDLVLKAALRWAEGVGL